MIRTTYNSSHDASQILRICTFRLQPQYRSGLSSGIVCFGGLCFCHQNFISTSKRLDCSCMTSIVNGNLDSVLTHSGLGVDVADVDLLIGQMGTMDPPLDRRWARAGIGAWEIAGIILHICLNTPRLWPAVACAGLLAVVAFCAAPNFAQHGRLRGFELIPFPIPAGFVLRFRLKTCALALACPGET